MKYEIKNRFTGATQFVAEIDGDKNAENSVKLRLALKWGSSNGVNLSGAYLSGADLSGADLSGADLSSADLRGANLRGAGLRGANLSSANLSSANLSGARIGAATLAGEHPVIQIGPIGSRGAYLVAFIADTGIIINAGCFCGTLAAFSEAVKKTHGEGIHAQEYTAAIAMIEAHDKLWRPACP